MGKRLYSIWLGYDRVACDVDEDYVSIIVKGILTTFYEDRSLKITIEAQEHSYYTSERTERA